MSLPAIPTENFRTARMLCEPVCTPIFVGANDVYSHQAMGLLFAVADAHFLVTCRHAVCDVVQRGGGLWIPRDGSPEAVPLTPKFYFAKSSLLDLAIMKLPDEFVRCFSQHRFARAVDTHSSDQPEGISCVMYGVLATESQTWDASVTPDDPKLQTTVFIGRTTKTDADSDYIVDEYHFLISADNLVSIDEMDGMPREPPKSFRGLSGTPVFAVNDNPFEPNWNAHDTKIIGIQSAVITLHQEKRVVMRVVRLELMYHAIRELYPSVGETLDKLKPINSIRYPTRI